MFAEKRRALIEILEESEEDFRQGRYIELNSREEQTQFFNELLENARDEAAQNLPAGKTAIR